MSARVVGNPLEKLVKPCQMNHGEIGVVVTGYVGKIELLVLKIYQHIVDLNNPRATWSARGEAGEALFGIRVLPKGTVIELVAE